MNTSPFRTGTIISFEPKTCTCDVSFSLWDGVIKNVPIMGTAGGTFSNDLTVTQTYVGQLALLAYVDAQWYVVGTLPMRKAISASGITSTTGTDTGADTYSRSENPNDYVAGRFSDYLPGDKVLQADNGGFLLLGTGGLAILQASPLAQVQLGAGKDFCRIVAREFEVASDVGMMRFTGGGPNGGTSLLFTGGASYSDESATDDAPATSVKMALGNVPGDPNARFALLVDHPLGSNHVHTYVGIDGTYSTEMTDDNDLRIGGNSTHVVNKNEYHYVIGDQVEVIGDDPSEAERQAYGEDYTDDITVAGVTIPGNRPKKSGNRDVTVKLKDKLTVEGDQETTVQKSRSVSVLLNDSETVLLKKDVTALLQFDITTRLLNLKVCGISISSPPGFKGAACTLSCSSFNISRG